MRSVLILSGVPKLFFIDDVTFFIYQDYSGSKAVPVTPFWQITLFDEFEKLTKKNLSQKSIKSFSKNYVKKFVPKICQKICPKNLPKNLSKKSVKKFVQKICQKYVQKICQKICLKNLSKNLSK